MLEEPTSLRIDDPGVRALFTEAARLQSWLDVEAALAQAQAELGIIPDAAAREITRSAAVVPGPRGRARGLARTGIRWCARLELDRACEGDAGATCTGERRPRTSRRPVSCCRYAEPTTSSCASSRRSSARSPTSPSARRTLCPGRTHGNTRCGDLRLKVACGSTSSAATWSACAALKDACSSPCWAVARDARLAR